MRLNLKLPGGALKISDGSGLRTAMKHGAPYRRLGPFLLVWWSAEAQNAVKRRHIRGQRRL